MSKNQVGDYWEKFIKEYSSERAFWYAPKGEAVNDLDRIRKRLEVLSAFDGQQWSKVQNKYVDALKKKKLFQPRARGQRRADQAAIGRMIKIVLDWLGLAWVDEHSAIYVTSTGKEFLEKGNEQEVVEKQLWKFQFWNPGVPEYYNVIKLIPHAFLVRVLLNFADGITADEYDLFVVRARHDHDFHKVVQQIENWRNTSEKVQNSILARLEGSIIESAKADEPVSMYTRIERVRSYAWDFHTSGSHLEADRKRLRIKKGRVASARNRLRLYESQGTVIEFIDRKEWFSYYGDFAADNNDLAAKAVYEKRNEIDKAVESFRKAQQKHLLPPSSVEAYKEARIREIILEDFLEYHVERLESGLSLHKERDRNGRQYPTVVGPIDILARNSHGSWVVIELKRDRASDRVMGQTSRYMGWVKNNLASSGQKVRGIIVGATIDEKLEYAIVGSADITAYTFDFRFNFKMNNPLSKAS